MCPVSLLAQLLEMCIDDYCSLLLVRHFLIHFECEISLLQCQLFEVVSLQLWLKKRRLAQSSGCYIGLVLSFHEGFEKRCLDSHYVLRPLLASCRQSQVRRASSHCAHVS